MLQEATRGSVNGSISSETSQRMREVHTTRKICSVIFTSRRGTESKLKNNNKYASVVIVPISAIRCARAMNQCMLKVNTLCLHEPNNVTNQSPRSIRYQITLVLVPACLYPTANLIIVVWYVPAIHKPSNCHHS